MMISSTRRDENDSGDENGKVLKVLVVGDSLVGKSSFIEKYINGKIRKTGTGVDFALKFLRCQEQFVKLQLWDINGEAGDCSSIMKLYYKGASACVIIFDVTQRASFENVIQWKNDVETLTNVSRLPCLLLANKVDLPSPCVSDDEIKELCNQQNFIGWGNVSAKERTNIDKSMLFLVERTLVFKG